MRRDVIAVMVALWFMFGFGGWGGSISGTAGGGSGNTKQEVSMEKKEPAISQIMARPSGGSGGSGGDHRGCCSSHGGIAGCNENTGWLLCKDGWEDSTCRCD